MEILKILKTPCGRARLVFNHSWTCGRHARINFPWLFDTFIFSGLAFPLPLRVLHSYSRWLVLVGINFSCRRLSNGLSKQKHKQRAGWVKRWLQLGDTQGDPIAHAINFLNHSYLWQWRFRAHALPRAPSGTRRRLPDPHERIKSLHVFNSAVCGEVSGAAVKLQPHNWERWTAAWQCLRNPGLLQPFCCRTHPRAYWSCGVQATQGSWQGRRQQTQSNKLTETAAEKLTSVFSDIAFARVLLRNCLGTGPSVLHSSSQVAWNRVWTCMGPSGLRIRGQDVTKREHRRIWCMCHPTLELCTA